MAKRSFLYGGCQRLQPPELTLGLCEFRKGSHPLDNPGNEFHAVTLACSQHHLYAFQVGSLLLHGVAGDQVDIRSIVTAAVTE